MSLPHCQPSPNHNHQSRSRPRPYATITTPPKASQGGHAFMGVRICESNFFFQSPSRSYSPLPNLPLPLPAHSVLKTRGTKPMADTTAATHAHAHGPRPFADGLHCVPAPRHTPRMDQGQHLPRFLHAQPVVRMRVILGASFLCLSFSIADLPHPSLPEAKAAVPTQGPR